MGPLTLACVLVAAPVQADDQDDDWGPDEAWTVAQRTDSGAVRARALVAAIEEVAGDPEAQYPRLVAAFEAFRADHDAFELERASALARAMHRHAGATWSAYCLEGILRRAGDYEAADAVLVEHLARVEVPAERLDVLQRRAIVSAGAGWRARERDHLGAALARGGTDAYQMLGRLALVAGDVRDARSLFRVLVERHLDAPEDAPPWALRGWGLALLPARHEPLRRAPRAGGR